MASIPELLNGHVTLEVECVDRLYLNGYIGRLATSGGLVTFMREQLDKPIPSPVVLGQVTEKFREAVKAMSEWQQIPVYQFDHKSVRMRSPTRYDDSVASATGSSSSESRRRRRRRSKARRSKASSSTRAAGAVAVQPALPRTPLLRLRPTSTHVCLSAIELQSSEL